MLSPNVVCTPTARMDPSSVLHKIFSNCVQHNMQLWLLYKVTPLSVVTEQLTND